MTMEETLQKEEATKDTLKATLDGIIKITPDSLVRAEELGTSFNFEECKPIFERIINIFHSLNELNLDGIPLETLNNLLSSAEQVQTNFTKVLDFNPKSGPNPAQARNSLIETLITIYTHLYKTLSPIIAYSVPKGVDIEEMSRTVTKLIQVIESNKENAENLLAEMQDTQAKVRDVAAKIGVAQHAIHFKEQADEHKAKTAKWLIATGISAFCTLAWGFILQ
ncbi:hypothetical protein ACFL1R_06735 [Candidatus Latescibacterota bacterium]